MIDLVLLENVLTEYRPGSYDATGWSWDDEEADIRSRVCVCCDREGHYQEMIETFMESGAQPGTTPILLGDDYRVWDGHHRIIGARKHGWKWLVVEYGKSP